MDDQAVIRYPSDPPPHRRRWAVPAAFGALALLAGALVLVGGFRRSTPLEETTTTVDPVIPDPLETALVTVEEFALAWNDGDAAEAAARVDPAWTEVALPGFTDPRVDPEADAGLGEALGFLVPLSGIDLGSCRADLPPPESAATAVVRCDEAAFTGDYLDAVGRNTWEGMPLPPTASRPVIGLTFQVRDDRILSIRGGEAGFTPQAYCIWVEGNLSGSEAPRFDLACLPDTAAAAAPAHAAAAAAYLEAGAPLPSLAEAATRLSAGYVERYALLHDAGDTITIGEWLAGGIRAADLPGFAGGDPDPIRSEFLAWSSRLVRLDLGVCSIGYGEGVTVVTCPGLSVTTPWTAEPIPQPARFTIRSLPRGGPVARSPARILAVEPLGDSLVPVGELCRVLQATRPATAAEAFTADCEPVYTADAADALAAALTAPGAPVVGG